MTLGADPIPIRYRERATDPLPKFVTVDSNSTSERLRCAKNSLEEQIM